MVTITLCTRQQKRHWCIDPPGLLFDLKFVSDGVSFPFLPQYLGTFLPTPHLLFQALLGSLWVLPSSRASAIVCGLFWTSRARGGWAGHAS